MNLEIEKEKVRKVVEKLPKLMELIDDLTKDEFDRLVRATRYLLKDEQS